MNNPVKKEKVAHLVDNISSFLGKKMNKVENKAENLGLIEHRVKSGPGMLFGALAGVAVGAAAALLLAKQSGSDLRSKLNTQLSEAKKKLNENKGDALKFAKRESENVVNAAKANSKDFTHQGN